MNSKISLFYVGLNSVSHFKGQHEGRQITTGLLEEYLDKKQRRQDWSG